MALVGLEVIHECPVASRQVELWLPDSRVIEELSTEAEFSIHLATGRCLLGECLSRGVCLMADNFTEEGTHSYVVAGCPSCHPLLSR